MSSSSAQPVDLTGDDESDDDVALVAVSSKSPRHRETERREALQRLSAAHVVPPPQPSMAQASRSLTMAPPPNAKRAKPSSVAAAMYVLVKGDWPRSSSAKLVNIKVLGTYSSQALADAAKATYLQRGGWEEGYGYHQGNDAESRIEIYRTVLDAPAR